MIPQKLISFIIFLFLINIYNAQSICKEFKISDHNGNSAVNVDCNYVFDSNGCISLKADYTKTKATNVYIQSSIPFDGSIPVDAGAVVNQSIKDDKWGNPIDLPFDFCYFGNVFNKIVIGDNGVVSFDTSLAGKSCTFTAASLPNTSLYKNTIYGAYHDITNDDAIFGCDDDPSTAQNECGDIRVLTMGVAPCRKFVINYNNINHFGCVNVHSSFQIILYETTNIIDVNIFSKPLNCESPNPLSDYRKKATIGIMDGTGNLAYTPAGRNAAVFNISDESYRFSPNGNDSSFVDWVDANGNILASNTDVFQICDIKEQTVTARLSQYLCDANNIANTKIDYKISIDPKYPVTHDNSVEICDILGDGTEAVNLGDYDTLLCDNASNFSKKYYTTLADAQNGTNAISNPSSFGVQQNSKIYVSFIGPGCNSIAELTFTLVIPATILKTTLEICDVKSDNTETLNLANYTSQLVQNPANYTIKYYKTKTDAENSTNEITQFQASNNSEFWLKSERSGCITYTKITVQLIATPVVKNVNLTLCSNVYYDFTQNYASVISNFSQYDLSLYTSLRNADYKISPLNASNVLITQNAYYLRVENPNTGCYTVATFNITLNEPKVKNFYLIKCDTDSDNAELFDLEDGAKRMSSNNLASYNVEYYETYNGALNRISTDLIPSNSIHNFSVTFPQVSVYIRFEDKASGCVAVKKLDLVVAQLQDYTKIDFSYCADPLNTNTLVNLSNLSGGIISQYFPGNYSNIAYFVEYYETQQDANNGTNKLQEYDIPTSKQLFIKVIVGYKKYDTSGNILLDADGNPVYEEVCSKIFPITITRTNSVEITETPISVCNNNNDDTEKLNLGDYTTFYTSNPSYSNFEYLGFNQNVINPNNSTVYTFKPYFFLRFTNEFGCKELIKYPIEFIKAPEVTKPILEVCDFGNDNTEDIDLSHYEKDYVQDSQNYTFGYYKDYTAAVNNITSGLIPNYTQFTVTSTQNTVYVRMENTVTGCFSVNTVTFTFQAVPNIYKTAFVCDTNGTNVFPNYDLSLLNPSILDDYTQFQIQYFTNISDAQNNINEISNYNITDGTQLAVRIVSNVGCLYYSEITVSIFQIPTLKSSVSICDDNNDGTENVVLKEVNNAMVTNGDSYSIIYYKTQSDFDTNTNPIQDTEIFTLNANETLFYKVQFNRICSSYGQVSINLFGGFDVGNSEILICDLDNNLEENFDLTSKLPEMLPTYSNYTVTYYKTEEAANIQDVNEQITQNFNNYRSNQEFKKIYIRFENPTTGCYSIGVLTLHISPIPKLVNLSIPLCDDDFNGTYEINLLTLNDQLIENPENYTFTYFSNYLDAINSNNALDSTRPYSTVNQYFSVFVRVENSNGCFSIAEAKILGGDKSIANLIDPIYLCDNENDLKETVDIVAYEYLINPNLAEFTFYENYNDFRNDINPVQNLSDYPLTKAVTILYVKVEEPGKCANLGRIQFSLLKAPTSNHETEYTICDGTDITIGVQPNYSKYEWLGRTETTPTITVSEGGTYQVKVTDINGCYSIFSILVKIFPPVEINIEFTGPSSVVVKTSDSSLDWLYSLDGVNFTSNPIFENLPSGINSIYVKDSYYGCINYFEFYCLGSSNVITPNSDGLNDVWEIRDLEFFNNKEAQMRIFDRYGKLVYTQNSSISLSWDGRYNGFKVPSDTYWFVINLPDGKKYTGYILVKDR